MLHYRHNNFYAPVTPSWKEWRQRKQIIKNTTQQLSCSTHLKMRQDMRDQKTKAQIKKPYEIIPTPCPPTHTLICINHPHLSHFPIIHNNNTIDTEFLIKMRQSNKCGSVRNDEIFNLHLGSGAGPWVSIPCLLQE